MARRKSRATWGLLLFLTPTLAGGPLFLRGDANDDGRIDIADAIKALSHLFGQEAVHCIRALDSNGDRAVDIADPIFLLAHLFAGGSPPPAPFPGCGLEGVVPSGPAPLPCDTYASCTDSNFTQLEGVLGPEGGEIALPSGTRLAAGAGVFRRDTTLALIDGRLRSSVVPSAPAPLIRLEFDARFLNVIAGDLSISPAQPFLGKRDGEQSFVDVLVSSAQDETLLTLPLAADGAIDLGAVFRWVVAETALAGLSIEHGGERFEFLRLVGPGGKGGAWRARFRSIAGGIRDGFVEFIDETGKLVVRIGDQIVATIEWASDVVVEFCQIVGDAAQTASRRKQEIVGDGELYQVDFKPDGSLAVGAAVQGPRSADGRPDVICVHGVDLFHFVEYPGFLLGEQNFLRRFFSALNGIDIREEQIKEAARDGWKHVITRVAEKRTVEGTRLAEECDFYVLSYPTHLSVHERTGPRLAEKLRGTFGLTGGGTDRTVIVGHSMGGLLALQAMHDLYGAGGAMDVTDEVLVLTLDTPFRGSPWANDGFVAGLFASELLPLSVPSDRVRSRLAACRMDGLCGIFGERPLAETSSSAIVMACSVIAGVLVGLSHEGGNDLDFGRFDTLLASLPGPAQSRFGAFATTYPACPEHCDVMEAFQWLGGVILDSSGQPDPPYAPSDGIVPNWSAYGRTSAHGTTQVMRELGTYSDLTHMAIVGEDAGAVHDAVGEEIRRFLDPLPETRENRYGMRFRLVREGRFFMGSATGRPEEMPRREVVLTGPIYISETVVTMRQWHEVMLDATPESAFPMAPVDYLQAQNFCMWLSALEGGSCRLPTEAEWEYACRAGSTADYCFGNDSALLPSYAWYWDNWGSLNASAPNLVALKQPNAWGLFDMHGNVWEWCGDWLDTGYYATRPSVDYDPQGPPAGSQRVLRGGSWTALEGDCRSSTRIGDYPDSILFYPGFRVVLEPLED